MFIFGYVGAISLICLYFVIIPEAYNVDNWGRKGKLTGKIEGTDTRYLATIQASNYLTGIVISAKILGSKFMPYIAVIGNNAQAKL